MKIGVGDSIPSSPIRRCHHTATTHPILTVTSCSDLHASISRYHTTSFALSTKSPPVLFLRITQWYRGMDSAPDLITEQDGSFMIGGDTAI
uniref:Uncharacterized protein n=1 Tax=Lactuca sativa TaxID=4236 RepID=A0A9R1UKP6_LACSA|nr:hypothetical protein LSAT_V11C900470830 [Lactuca sativa]